MRSLDCNNLRILWDEVMAYWKNLGKASGSKTSAFTLQG